MKKLPPSIAADNAEHSLVTITREGLTRLRWLLRDAIETQLELEELKEDQNVRPNPIDHLAAPIMALSDCRTEAERVCCSVFISIAAKRAAAWQKVLDRRVRDI